LHCNTLQHTKEETEKEISKEIEVKNIQGGRGWFGFAWVGGEERVKIEEGGGFKRGVLCVICSL